MVGREVRFSRVPLLLRWHEAPLSKGQTVEDGWPRDAVYAGLVHDADTDTERRVMVIPLRDRVTYGISEVYLVVRASMATGEITVSCVKHPFEDGDA